MVDYLILCGGGGVEWSSVVSCRVMTYVWRVVQVIKGIIAVGELILGVNKWVTEWNKLLLFFLQLRCPFYKLSSAITLQMFI